MTSVQARSIAALMVRLVLVQVMVVLSLNLMASLLMNAPSPNADTWHHAVDWYTHNADSGRSSLGLFLIQDRRDTAATEMPRTREFFG